MGSGGPDPQVTRIRGIATRHSLPTCRHANTRRRPSPSRAGRRSLLVAAALLLPAAAPVAAAEPDWPATNSGYHNWPELVAEVKQAGADYPSIVSVFSIGKSGPGLDIWMAKVSDNVAEDEAEPEVLIDALTTRGST